MPCSYLMSFTMPWSTCLLIRSTCVLNRRWHESSCPTSSSPTTTLSTRAPSAASRGPPFGDDVPVKVRRRHGCIDGKRGHPYASIACMDDIDGKRGHPYAPMTHDDSDILALVWLSGQ